MTRAWELVHSANGMNCHGTLVTAMQQTNGRGRQGRSWISEPGKNLLFSLVLSEHPVALPTISNAVPVALCKALSRFTDVSIKFPNDIVCHGRKLAGILIERSHFRGIPYVNIGIGINVTQQLEDLPANTTTPPTSLLLESGRSIDLDCILRHICEELELCFKQTSEEIAMEMTQYCSTLGKNVVIDLKDGLLFGIAETITPDGALKVNVRGQYRHIYSGEILRLQCEAEAC